MKKVGTVVLTVIMFLCLASCSENTYRASSYSMGAAVNQTVYGKNGGQSCKTALELIEAFENEISYRKSGMEENSISYLNANKTAALTSRTLGIIRDCITVSEKTDGVFDITVLQVVKLWGFDGGNMALPDESDIAKNLEKVGCENIVISDNGITLENGIEIDLSAIGKGEACEIAIECHKKNGLEGGIVTVGGSVGVFGNKNGEKFVIGVRDPFDKNGLLAALYVTDTFVSTSGSYEKHFVSNGVSYHHLLDGNTGYPVNNGLVSVTVVCDDGGVSDMLSSACFCVGIEKALELLGEYSAEGIFVTEDKNIIITKGLCDVFECDRPFTVAGQQ